MITPETASQALASWLAYLQITQETATQLITRAFLEQPARPEIAVHRIERDDGTVDYGSFPYDSGDEHRTSGQHHGECEPHSLHPAATSHPGGNTGHAVCWPGA